MSESYQFITATGVYYTTILNKYPSAKKRRDRAIFEAFTNAWESIALKFSNDLSKGKITIGIYLKTTLLGDEIDQFDFEKITISDNGIGFDDENFQRVKTLGDNRKGYHNKGSGRIEYLSAFDDTSITSTYKTNESKLAERKFTLSKKTEFLKHNAIIRLDSEKTLDENKGESGSILTFKSPIVTEHGKVYSERSLYDFKEIFIKHYLSLFCLNIEKLPKITFIRYINNDRSEEPIYIAKGDLPQYLLNEEFDVNYSQSDGKTIKKLEDTAKFSILGFRVSEKLYKENAVYLISKNELAQTIDIPDISPKFDFDGTRFIFLVSGEYLNDNDSDARGAINLLTEHELIKQSQKNELLRNTEKHVLLDLLIISIHNIICQNFDEIQKKNKERKNSITKLKKTFYFASTIEEKIKIEPQDTDKSILAKYYKQQAIEKSKNDIQILELLERASALDVASKNIETVFTSISNEISKTIPQQNKDDLAEYIARRKLVLTIFSRIMELHHLDSQKIPESKIHNLVFKQNSINPFDSNLWIMNEEYLYFQGSSEKTIQNLEIDNKKIIKENLSEEELEYLHKKEKNDGSRRPDIYLFPKEGKCILIELKAPNVSISDHLGQINRYASLLNNLSKEEFRFDQFYGYLLGENIDIDSVRDSDATFAFAPALNYAFRTHYPIAGRFKRPDASIYTEIIKYSTLLERAQLRNQTFFDLLEKNYDDVLTEQTIEDQEK